MQPVTLCYHDITVGADPDASGFAGADAATYKLSEARFREHIFAIAHVNQAARLTFDDGGVSSLRIADILESFGFRGYFFVPTDFIGRPGFLCMRDIANLRHRGHVIGSHSCSHKGRMSSMSPDRLSREWEQSVKLLSDLVGENVNTGSVPSGFYSRRVGEAAARAGLKLLFTLEPTGKTEWIDGCEIAGRYLMRRRTSPALAVRLAAGRLAPRLRQQVLWSTKKLLKKTPIYTRARQFCFAASRHISSL
jgi:peptidoglycan/xylan/chitin deacetylase (PgdA/CDA1 family)